MLLSCAPLLGGTRVGEQGLPHRLHTAAQAGCTPMGSVAAPRQPGPQGCPYFSADAEPQDCWVWSSQRPGVGEQIHTCFPGARLLSRPTHFPAWGSPLSQEQTSVSTAGRAADQQLFILAERIFRETRSEQNCLVFHLFYGSGKGRGAQP